jgi:ribonuclease III
VTTETAQRTIDWADQAFGYRCRDSALLIAALTHRSAGGNNNE